MKSNLMEDIKVSPAFVDVMEQISKIKNVTYAKTTITPYGKYTSKITTDESGILRIDDHEQ